jgi:alpha-L-fucosidase 2
MPISRRNFVVLGAAASLAPRAYADRAADRVDDGLGGTSELIDDSVDWGQFLGHHDLLWDRVPTTWGESPFLGNGRLAMSVKAQPDDTRSLWFSIDNSDVYDRRDLTWGWTAYSRSRYHVGDFLLTPVGRVTDLRMRLVLYDGELVGNVTTSVGSIDFIALVHATRMIALVDLRTSEGERNCRWEWNSGEAISSRKPIRNPQDQEEYQRAFGHPVKIWIDNSPAERFKRGGVEVSLQKLRVGGAYATAWKEIASSSHHRALLATCIMSYPGLQSLTGAINQVQSSAKLGFETLQAQNRRWWHSYYPSSFLSVPDRKLESFYWIQMYKYGCASPKNNGVIDTHGPWLQPTNWPYVTWNLNSQISYWALQPGNHLALADPLFRALDNNLGTLRDNSAMFAKQRDVATLGHCSQQDLEAPLKMDVRFEREWGNLLWICHNYWLQYRFSMDGRMLRDRLFPLLRNAVNFYLPVLEQGADGKLHLPATFSPEIGATRDCNYDLALLRWACRTLLDACARLRWQDPLIAKWKDISSRLTDYPIDENGLRIGADLPAAPHRHFSHLLMIYPLYLMNWDNVSSRPLIEKSIEYWYSPTRPRKSDAGFTLAVGSSFYSSIGRGQEALACLQALLNAPTGIGKIMPNTMYAESGQNIETPLAAAQAFHDMLLQSWGDRLRIFPAVPMQWRDLVFHNLRAQGAFLVSACMQDSKLSWVRVKSLHGEPCHLQCSFPTSPHAFMLHRKVDVHALGDDFYRLDLNRGEEVLLTCDQRRTPVRVEPLPSQSGLFNQYGVHDRLTKGS